MRLLFPFWHMYGGPLTPDGAGGLAPGSADAAELCSAGPGVRLSAAVPAEEAAPWRAELRCCVPPGR